MARLPRVTQKIFAGSAANNGVFGSAQAGTKVLSNNLTTLMGLAAWDQGWLNAVLGASKFPALEEDQGLHYVVTSQLAYLLAQGISEYDAGTTYYQFNIVVNPLTFDLYGSLTNANIGNPLSDGTNWKKLNSLNPKVPVPTYLTAGSGTYTTPAGALYLEVEMVGGGGGGAGSGTTPGAAGDGVASTFGALNCAGGLAGATTAGGVAGGTASGGDVNINGASGGSASTGTGFAGGYGGATPFGGMGSGGGTGVGGQAASTNTGAGGGGAGESSTPNTGGGGGGGGYLRKQINSPVATYAYAVGAGGAHGTAGTGGFAGGDGASGLIVVKAYFQ